MLKPGWLVGTLIVSAAATTQAGLDDAAAEPGPGSDRRGTAVLDRLGIAGEASADVEGGIRRAVLRGLTGEGVRVIEPPGDAPPKPCADASCAAARAAASKADYLIGGEVRLRERNYELKLELRDGRDGRALATKTASCPICSMPEVEAVAASAAVELAASMTAPEVPPLSINSEPSGALVFIDGTIAGLTPFTQSLAPGEHRVEIRKDGYRDEARTVTIDAGAAPDVLSFPLAAVESRKSMSPMVPLGWAAVGLGAASLVTGVALLVLDERPFEDLCEGEYVDSFGRCRFRYNTLAGGVAGVVAGAALLGGGAALLVVDRKRRGKGSRASARVGLGVHPRGLTLSGQF